MTDEQVLLKAIGENVQALDALKHLIESRNSWRRIAQQNGAALDSCYEALERAQGINEA